MRIYSTNINWETVELKLHETKLASEGVVLRHVVNIERNERSRWPHAFDFTLRTKPGDDRFGKRRNHPSALSRPVPIDPTYTKVPTYNEWGLLIAALYEVDPNAHIAHFKNSDHFHKVTHGDFYSIV